jgi:FAD-dependent halogenase
MSERTEDFDVVVVGAGPAGATAATLVAMRGHRVLLIEKEALPVYKIGESLLPSTIHGICALLGVSDEIKAANFVRKAGGTFRWGKNKEPWTFAFSAAPEFPGPTSFAYQVERLKFDKILVDNARRRGVDVRERHAARAVHITDDRVTGLSIVDPGGETIEVRARYVVDASGHGTPIARHAGQRVLSKFFRNLAIFGYYRNGDRLPPPNSGNIFCAAFERGWIWYIPLGPDLTSVGAVIGQEHAESLRQDRDAALAGLIAECPPVQRLLAKAQRITDEGPYGEIRVRKDFSYCHTAFWRPGLVLAGDAACFIDPVFSSGVHLATYAGLLAARSINTCLADPASETEVFTEFQRRYLREYQYFHDFLVAFYDMEQDLDGYYWAARRVLQSGGAGGEAFIRLVGGIGSSGEALFVSAREAGIAQTGLAEHLFPAAHGTGHMYVHARTAASPAIQARGGGDAGTRDQYMTELTAEGVQMQMQGSQFPYEQPPLFENGLVPSTDGLAWIVPRAAQDDAAAGGAGGAATRARASR